MTDEIHERLVNFARWARTGRGARATCYSAEGRYVPELLRGDAEADRRTPLAPIDVRDALTVWRAITPANGFPQRWFLVISAVYIWRLEGWQLVGYMRRHGVPVGRSDAEHAALLASAVVAARNALDRRAVATRSQMQ